MERKKMMSEGGGGHGGDMDLKPFINFLIVLVPVLMLSAEFAKISIITLKLPENRGSQTTTAQQTPPLNSEDDKLMLTMIVTDSVVTLGAKGGFLPSMWYKEFHRYVSSTNKEDVVMWEFNPVKPDDRPICKETGKPFKVGERQDILLEVTDENRNIQKCMYLKKDGKMITDESFLPITSVSPGQTVYVLCNPRKSIQVTNPADFELRNLNAYDEMKNRLMKVKDRFKEASDANDVIIAAEDQVAYDKIVQLMDIAREADFPNISIAKLRS